MGITMTSREFNRDVSAAKRVAEQGPVTITDHGRRSHVLMTAEDFDRLAAGRDLFGDRLRRGQLQAQDQAQPVVHAHQQVERQRAHPFDEPRAIDHQRL